MLGSDWETGLIGVFGGVDRSEECEKFNMRVKRDIILFKTCNGGRMFISQIEAGESIGIE